MRRVTVLKLLASFASLLAVWRLLKLTALLFSRRLAKQPYKLEGQPKIKELWVYPVKSLGGQSVEKASVLQAGFQHDRRWMIVNSTKSPQSFVSQRSFPALALLSADVVEQDGSQVLKIYERANLRNQILVKLVLGKEHMVSVRIWDSTVDEAVDQGDEVAAFVSKYLTAENSTKFRLVYMPEAAKLPIDSKYAVERSENLTSFSDGFPYLICSENSLIMLNNHLTEKYKLVESYGVWRYINGANDKAKNDKVLIKMNRFRPNIILSNVPPFAEDFASKLSVDKVTLNIVKPSSRCKVTQTNQESAKIYSAEPIPSLEFLKPHQGTQNSNPLKKDKVYFGQNAVPSLESNSHELHVNQTVVFK